MGLGIVRGCLLLVGALCALGGLVAVSAGGEAAFAGVWAVIIGLVLVAAVLLERTRYRSSDAEVTSEAPGPGGGEPIDRPMEPRFRRTDERFIDPTTGLSMRVWIDPDSGERRYRAED